MWVSVKKLKKNFFKTKYKYLNRYQQVIPLLETYYPLRPSSNLLFLSWRITRLSFLQRQFFKTFFFLFQNISWTFFFKTKISTSCYEIHDVYSVFFVGLLLQRGTKIFLYEYVAKNLLFFFIVKNRRRNKYFSCVLILGARMCVHTSYGLTISLNRFNSSSSIWRVGHPNKTNKISMPSRASLDVLAQAVIIAFKSDGSQIFINKMETPVKLECLLVES